jgi:hypothetical protein
MSNFLDASLKLPGLKKYSCVFWGFSAHHSRLYIRLYSSETKPDDHMYLEFHSVSYFQGPMRWTGANFRFGTRDEFVKVINSGIVELSEDVIDHYLNSYRLFLIEQPSFTIKIVAWSDVQVIYSQVNSQIHIN